MIKLGIIGCGNMSDNFLDRFHDIEHDIKVVATVDVQ